MNYTTFYTLKLQTYIPLTLALHWKTSNLFGISRFTNFSRDQFKSETEEGNPTFQFLLQETLTNAITIFWEFTQKNARGQAYIRLINNYSLRSRLIFCHYSSRLNQIKSVWLFQYLHNKWFEHLQKKTFQSGFNWRFKTQVYAKKDVLFGSRIIVLINSVPNNVKKLFWRIMLNKCNIVNRLDCLGSPQP